MTSPKKQWVLFPRDPRQCSPRLKPRGILTSRLDKTHCFPRGLLPILESTKYYFFPLFDYVEFNHFMECLLKKNLTSLGGCHNLVSEGNRLANIRYLRQMLILELIFCGVIWPFALALKWNISTKKMSFDEGKETNKSKEERQDPFLCRKENKTTFLKVCLRLSELWFVILLISTCFATACYVFFLPLATLPV